MNPRTMGAAWRRAALLALGTALVGVLASLPASAKDAEPALAGVVNLNTATAEELELLPGVGAAKAKAILDARKQRGGFKSVDELVEVKGIGKSALERLRPFLAVEGKTTAHPR